MFFYSCHQRFLFLSHGLYCYILSPTNTERVRLKFRVSSSNLSGSRKTGSRERLRLEKIEFIQYGLQISDENFSENLRAGLRKKVDATFVFTGTALVREYHRASNLLKLAEKTTFW